MTTDVLEIRRTNLKVLIAQWGGPTSLAKKLKLSGPSYLSQIVGGSRPVTERTARKLEKELGLGSGWMDINHETDAKPASLDDSLVTRAILLVGTSLAEIGITVAPTKFAEIVTLVYGEAERSGRLDEQLAHRIVNLLK